MKHRMFHPLFLTSGDGKSFEQFLSSFVIGMESGGKKRFAEPSGTAQKDVF